MLNTIQLEEKVPIGALGRILIQRGLLKEKEAEETYSRAVKEHKTFVSCLIEQNALDPTMLATIFSQVFGIPLMKLEVLDLQKIPENIITTELTYKLHALPIFRRGNRLFVAISDPTNLKAIDEIRYKTHLFVEAILVEEPILKKMIEKLSSKCEITSMDILNEEDDYKISIEAKEIEDAPIVRFINKVILEAVNKGASDLHFEPYEKTYRIRLRQDGLLFEQSTPPINLANRLSARLKIMARLDISERRLPQDGRFKMRVLNRSIDFRVSTCPTLFGEKVVVRILDPAQTTLKIDALGYEDFQKALFLNAIHKPQGMVLVTGPTGSGKTHSLYTALNILNTNERNISTCEDPVEINLPGINQIPINVKIGLTFATILRALLRQDPDVMMVGEVRDLETAEISIKAAQTGHLVLSTLHTNSAADTVTRFINMGIPPYNLATSITLIVAQRLARVLCSFCKTPIKIPESALLQAGFIKTEIPTFKLFGPKGCEHCKEGYRGRIGIYEVMPISPAISHMIMSGAHALDIYRKAVEEGMWDLQKSGLQKVKQGLTSLEELSRITYLDYANSKA